MSHYQLDYHHPNYQSEKDSTREVPQYISLDASALQATDCIRHLLCNLCKHIHSAINDVTVKPCDRLTDNVEDNLMSYKHVDFIPVETTIGCSPKPLNTIGHLRRNIVILAIENSCQCDCNYCYDDACDSYRHLQVDIVRLTIPCHEVTERNET